MDVNRLFSLLKPPQVLSQESQQAYQEKLNRANEDRAMIKENVVNPFFAFADKSFKKIMEVLNPGESYVAPALKKIGVNPIVAGGIGLGVDILAPGPGELGRVAKVGKEVKAGSKIAKEAKDLLVVHNLSEPKLRFADRIGGLANPSTAVINPKITSFESYGDISLIGNKELIRGEKTYLADAYTPRFPSVHSTMDYKDYRALENEFEPYYKKIGDDSRKIEFDDTNMIRNIENNPAVALKFLESKGIKPSSEGQHYFYQQIEKAKLGDEFQEYLDNIYKKFNIKEQMFAGYTPSGNRRYKSVSLEEASKIMAKQKDEGFNYGLGSYRSKLTPVVKSPDIIKKEKGRLLAKDDFEKIKESYDNELWDIKEKLSPYARVTDSSNQFIESDNQLNAIGELIMGEKDAMKYFTAKFPEAPQKLVDKILSFREKLKNMPTEYFETKFKRPVGLEEFSIAVVPEEISKSALDILQKRGLQIIKYAKGQKDKVMKDLLNHPEAFGFAPIGAIPFLPKKEEKNKTK